MSKCILRLPEVIKKTGLSRSSIYGMMQNGTFPKRISLGARAVGWIEKDIEEWIDARTLHKNGGV